MNVPTVEPSGSFSAIVALESARVAGASLTSETAIEKTRSAGRPPESVDRTRTDRTGPVS